jgi:hypothetical protein
MRTKDVENKALKRIFGRRGRCGGHSQWAPQMLVTFNICRSQWPRGLRHEMPFPAQTLGSWVRIPLEAWIFVCFYSVCVVLCVGIGLAKG